MDIDALETSFDLVAPKGDELMEIFYSNLFAVAPSVQPLFAGADMARQRAMLLSALVLLRKSLRDLDAVVPTLKRLGARHVAYGARAGALPGRRQRADRRDGARRGPRRGSRASRRPGREAFGVVAGAMLEGAAEAELALAA